MNKKDYIKVGEILRRFIKSKRVTAGQVNWLLVEFVRMFEEDNLRFDKEKWVRFVVGDEGE
jgi:hypothetical protein